MGYHATTGVGYGKDSLGKYYIVSANSWGSQWGDAGLFRIKATLVPWYWLVGEIQGTGSGYPYPIPYSSDSSPSPSPAPAPAPEANPWSVHGDCTVVGACVQSSNYPRNYGLNERCVITPDSNYWAKSSSHVYVERFDTEKGFDKITVNGKMYSGARGKGWSKVTPT